MMILNSEQKCIEKDSWLYALCATVPFLEGYCSQLESKADTLIAVNNDLISKLRQTKPGSLGNTSRDNDISTSGCIYLLGL